MTLAVFGRILSQLMALTLALLAHTSAQSVHRFFIQAELAEWSYVDDRVLEASTALQREQTTRDATHLGTTFQKALYVEYTDATFAVRRARTPADVHLGLLGPLLRCVEGDRVVVHFRNALPFAAGLDVRGLFRLSANASLAVAPNGASQIVEWAVRDRSLPSAGSRPASATHRSSSMHLFYSSVADHHIDAGLVGALLVTRAEFARPAAGAPPRDVDREFVVALQQIDEDASPLAAANYAQFAATAAAPDTVWQNRKCAINGRIFNTLRGFNSTVRVGDRVRVHVVALGGDAVAALAGRQLPLLDGESAAIDFVAARAGALAITSSASDHAARGMHVDLVVGGGGDVAAQPTGTAVATTRLVQQWFVQTVVEPRTGACVYRAFADESFALPLADAALTLGGGVVGPLMRVRVGIPMFVTLRNNCSDSAGIQFDALDTAANSPNVVAPGEQATMQFTAAADAVGTYVYRSPTNSTSLVGVYVVVVGGADDDGAAAPPLDVVVGAVDATINGVPSDNEPLFTVPPHASVRLHAFAHHSAGGALQIDDVWLGPAAVRLADGVARSMPLTTPFAGVRRLRIGAAAALFAAAPNGDANGAVARERDAIARAPVRRIFVARAPDGAWAQFTDANFLGAGARPAVVRALSDERLELRVRAGDTLPALSNCLEHISGIGSFPPPVDVRANDSAAATVAHFVVATSLRAALSNAALDRSSAACATSDGTLVLLITRRGAERNATADLAPSDVDREFILPVDGGGETQFRARLFERVRWYVVSRAGNASRAVAWRGVAPSWGDVVAVAGGTVRTVDMIPDAVGSFAIDGVGGGAASLTVESGAAAAAAPVRRLDGVDVSQFHRHWGAAGAPFAFAAADVDLGASARLPRASEIAQQLLRSSPSLGSRRRPLVSQLLPAYTNFLLADLVELDVVDSARTCLDAASECVDEARTAVARGAAAVEAATARAVGGEFERAAIERDVLPAVANAQTHWIDGSQIYGTSAEANRRLRTLSGGQLSTDVARWPLQGATLQALALADLFVREHNRQAAALAAAQRGWSDEQLFQGARRVVVAAMQHIAIDELLPALIGEALPPYEAHEPDTRGDVSAPFALACAPALALGGTPSRVELLNADLAPIYMSANGGDAEGSADASSVSTDDCSGSAALAARCLAFGVEALVRGLYTAVAPAIDSSVGGAFAALRAGDAAARARRPLVDAATEWIVRGRDALLPTFAQLLRERGAAVPASMAELVGLGAGANLTALLERAQQALRGGAPYDERPALARALERLYPGGVEQLDAIVGLLVEPPASPLSSSVGPTLARCVREQLQRVRAADRFWHESAADRLEVAQLLAPTHQQQNGTSSSLLRRLLVLNYEFEDKAAGSVRSLGTLAVPAGLEAARDAVTRFVGASSTFTGGGARAVRLGFHAAGTYESGPMRYGYAHGDCIVHATALSDPANRGLERVPLEVMQLRNSADGALFVNMSDADLISLIGAVGATTASRGGLAMAWRRGRADIGAGTPEASVCPMHGQLPDALLGGDNAYPHARTLDAFRVKFQRQGFNDRELVALLGAHSLGGLHESVSGFPSGLWTLKHDVVDNTYFRNLLPFASPLNRAVVRSAADADKFAYRLVAGAHDAEVGVTMLPSDVALLGNAATRDWVERYAADNALFQRDFAHAFQRMLENGATGVGAPLPPLPETLDGGGTEAPAPVDESALERDSDAPGAPPQLPFFALRTQESSTFLFKAAPPVAAGARAWQATTQPLPALRVSFSADHDTIHVLLETPTDSYVGLGFGPRVPGASMRGADVVIVALNRDGTPVVRDSYAQLDQLQPTLDVALNGTDTAWFDVRAERVDGLSRYWLSRARRTGDKWDNDVPRAGLVETLFALGSVSLRDGDAADVLSTYHGAQRAAVLMEWPVAVDATTEAPRAVAPDSDGDDAPLPIVGIVLGAVGGALALLIGVVLCAVWFVRRQQARDAGAKLLLNSDEQLVDGERLAVPSHLKVCEMSDAAFPLALLNPSAGLFRDPVPAREYDEDVLFRRRAAQQAQQVPVRGLRLLAVEKVYCDILLLQNVSGEAQDVALYLPPNVPQVHVAVEPRAFRIAPDDVQAVKVSVLLTCTTKQRVTIKASAGKFVADLPTAKLESELSTLLDFDEIHLIERIGEGSYGVVFAGTWRKQAVAVKMLRQQQFEEQEQADLRAEAKLLTQLLHRNIVQFRGAVFRESQCCLVTELAPHGSLKAVLARYGLPWDLVIKLCVDMASGVQFLHTSGIIHRDIKSDNVLVFSLSPRESVCAKLTDFGSARAGRAHVDAAGQVQLGSQKQFSANEGTPIYMAPQLFARTSRPSEASDCYALGVLFYEVASEREPWADVPFAWNVAKLVMAGQRPTWPEQVVESAPAPFVPLVAEMWAQRAEARPSLDDVLQRLVDCQEALGDHDAALETRRNLERAAAGEEGGAGGGGGGGADVLDKRVVLALVSSGNNSSSTSAAAPDKTATPATMSSGGSSGRDSARLSSESPQPISEYARSLGLVRRASSLAKMSVGDSSDGDSSPFGTVVEKKAVRGANKAQTLSSTSVVAPTNAVATNAVADLAPSSAAAMSLAKRRTGGIVPKNKSITFVALQDPTANTTTTTTTTTTSSKSKTATGTASGLTEALVVVRTQAAVTVTTEKAPKRKKKKTVQVVDKQVKEKL